ncbi:MAG: tetratricopeptide repeat protein [Kofleriaceae bacterium]
MVTAGDPRSPLDAHAAGSQNVTLRVVINAPRPLDELSVARLIGQAAEAAHKAQTGGQALGMVSPEAILVQATGGVKLDLFSAPSIGHCAPERLRGLPGDRRSDVFSLGVVLWEALTRSVLFEGGTDDARRSAVLERDAQPPSQLNANVPAELDAICKKALARDPADRYQSAKVMAAEIGAVLDDAGYPDNNERIAAYLAASSFPSEPAAQPRSLTPTMHPPIRSATPTMPPPVANSAAPSPVGSLTTAPASNPIAPRPASPSTPPASDLARPKPSTSPPAEPARTTAPTAPPARPHSPSNPPPTTTALGLGTSPPPMAEPRAKSDSQAGKLSPTAFLSGGRTGTTSPPPIAGAADTGIPSIVNPAKEPSGGLAIPPIVNRSKEPSGGLAIPSIVNRTKEPSGGLAVPSIVHPQKEPSGSTAPPPNASATPALNPTATPALNPTATAVLGSSALAAELAQLSPPSAAAPSISTAETVATPALVPTASEPAPSEPLHVSPSGVVGLPATPPGAAPLETPGAAAPPQPNEPATATAATTETTATAEPGPAADPLKVVSLPRATTEPSQRDLLAGWGWSTDTHAALPATDEEYEEPPATKRPLMIAIGAAAGVLLVIVIVALIFSGGSKPKEQETLPPPLPGAPSRTAPASAVQPPVPPAAPIKAEQPAPTPMSEPASEPPAEPATAEPVAEPVAEPANTEPAKTEPVKTESAKTESAKTEPVKTEPVKTEPVKTESPKVKELAKSPEPKAELKKPKDKKPEAKKADPAAKRTAKATSAKPIDPYATPDKPAGSDAASVFKHGMQQYAHGDTAGALSTLKGSLATHPEYPPTWRGLGLVYEKLGQKSQAKNAYRRYLQLSPRASDAASIRARMERLGS